MQYYIPSPKIFKPQEIFPPHIIDKYTNKSGDIYQAIWRLMDSRTLWTAVKLRELFGTMIINDYLWGGHNLNRGFRDPITLIDKNHFIQTGEIIAEWSSFTSQHCFGRALDSSFKKVLAENVRVYIIQNKGRDEFKYITAIEKEVSWLHFDVRNFKNGHERFFIF